MDTYLLFKLMMIKLCVLDILENIEKKYINEIFPYVFNYVGDTIIIINQDINCMIL